MLKSINMAGLPGVALVAVSGCRLLQQAGGCVVRASSSPNGDTGSAARLWCCLARSARGLICRAWQRFCDVRQLSLAFTMAVLLLSPVQAGAGGGGAAAAGGFKGGFRK